MWYTFSDERGRRWDINQLGLWILVRQNIYNRALRRRSRIVREPRWIGPDRVSMETDFRGISAERERDSRPLYSRLEREAIQDGARVLGRLIELRQETERAAAEVRRMQRTASHEMYTNIERSVARGEMGAAVARQVRDLSVNVLLVGSGFLTGGASVAVLGAGSLLSGVGTYQDTGNVGAAVLNASGTFVVGAIPLSAGSAGSRVAMTARTGGESIQLGERITMIVVGAQVDATFAGAQALVEGNTCSEALRAATTRFGVNVISETVGLRLDRRAMPVYVRMLSDSLTDYSLSLAEDAITASPARAAMPEPASLPVATEPFCDADAVLSTGQCSARDWVRQIAMRPAR